MLTLLTALLLFSAPATQAGPKATDCASMKKLFSRIYAEVRTGCSRHSDCVSGHYAWDPCEVQAVAREQHVQDFEQTRSELHRLCGYVVKPCPSVLEPAYCVKGRCALHSEIAGRHKELRFRTPGVGNGEFTLMADTGVRCEAAPCPAAREAAKGPITGHRFKLPLKLFLEGPEKAHGLPAAVEAGARPPRMWFVIGGKAFGTEPAAYLADPSREIVLGPGR